MVSAETIALVTPFLLGAFVLGFALVELRSLLDILEDQRHRQYWVAEAILLVVFLLAYLAAAWLLVAGNRSLLASLTGAFALLGAVFAFLVVSIGERTIGELVRSRDELERREEEFERLYQVTDVLNRILRHNLRNNMNVILGRSDMIDEAGEGAEHVEAIQAEARRLVEIGEKARAIHDTLDAEVTADVRPAETFVAPAVATVQDEFPDASVTVEMEEEESWIEAGPLFETAVENVLDNAVRHNEGPSTVAVEIATRGDDVAVRIADDGPGIHPYEIQAIREHRETPLQHGSGLGLWLASWIVDQYDGAITFEDNDPAGTVVTLTLPRVSPPAGAGASASEAESTGSGSASD